MHFMKATTATARRRLAGIVAACLVAGMCGEAVLAQSNEQADATVVDGQARFQVLTPTLIRMEYSENEQFEDRSTFFAKNRSLAHRDYTTRIEGGWREIRTSEVLLRYRRGSGPFSAENVEVRAVGDASFRARPTWDSRQPCTYGGVCQAEDAQVNTGEVGYDQARYRGTGFVRGDGDEQVVAQWTVEDAPASDEHVLSLRYAGVNGDSLRVRRNGTQASTLALPSTGAGDQWERARKKIQLRKGTNTVTLSRTGDSSGVHLDYLTVSAPGDSLPEPGPDSSPENLGGWYRGLDYQNGPRRLHDGLLSRKGWFLLDDTETAVWTEDTAWVTPRERPDTYRDGYFFGYGTDYKTALRDLARLTGPAPLLPRWAFGVWFSRYYPYTAEEYREEVIPAFRDEQVPLDVLVVDTDFKAPDDWNGWNWNQELFPNPQEFMRWTDEQGLKVSLNIHPSIQHDDPQFPRADSIGSGLVRATGKCPGWQGGTEPCSVWNWVQPSHAKSYFALHAPFEEDGNDVWWLDWCCDNSFAPMKGLTQESWINHLYAERMRRQGKRGFVLSRSSASYQNRHTSEPGPWGEHRSTVHFTGDTYATWDMLNYQPTFTVQEGNVGIPYVSHDIGGFYGRHLPAELYARWVQMGTFQPIMRLHSRFGDRLPWDYRQPARDVAAKFLRLRESLVPYLYAVARESHDTGLPMTRGMYLEYPEREAAYRYDRQYLLGDQLLVAPVGQSGAEETACTVGKRCSGDRAEMEGATETGMRHEGFTGTGYASGSDFEGAAWTVRNVAEASAYEVTIRYANARGGDDRHEERTLSLYVNGEDVSQLRFPKTESWDDWTTVQTSVELRSGENTVALRKDAEDSDNINVDFVGVTAPGESLPSLQESIPEAAEKVVWFPPGRWIDFFTGRVHEGPRVDTLTVPLERMPVFAKAGGIVPMQPYMDHVGQKPVDPLLVRVFTGDDGRFRLYEDEGTGRDYRADRFARTEMRYDESNRTLTIAGMDGRYPGQPDERGYRITFVNLDRPQTVTMGEASLSEVEVEADKQGWWYDAEQENVVVSLEDVPVGQAVSVSVAP
jgi:alpha-glucosidase (family GH31 glycosyl hydrolase)